jgi:PAS domain-containing protein
LFEAELGSSRSAPVEDFADLFDHAPCGYLTTTADGRITRANATFSRWTEFSQSQLLDKRVRDLLTVSGRILYETNVAPLLRLRAGFEEVALDLVTASGQIVHMLVNAEGDREEDGALKAVRIVRGERPRRCVISWLNGRRRSCASSSSPFSVTICATPWPRSPARPTCCGARRKATRPSA